MQSSNGLPIVNDSLGTGGPLDSGRYQRCLLIRTQFIPIFSEAAKIDALLILTGEVAGNMQTAEVVSLPLQKQ
jgi:hypothetical protein